MRNHAANRAAVLASLPKGPCALSGLLWRRKSGHVPKDHFETGKVAAHPGGVICPDHQHHSEVQTVRAILDQENTEVIGISK